MLGIFTSGRTIRLVKSNLPPSANISWWSPRRTPYSECMSAKYSFCVGALPPDQVRGSETTWEDQCSNPVELNAQLHAKLSVSHHWRNVASKAAVESI